MTTLSKMTNEQLLDELGKRLQVNENASAEQNGELKEELLRMSARLREAEGVKSDFLSHMRNEINNPLTAILGLSAAIAKNAVEKNVKQMSSLIHEESLKLDFQLRNIFAAAEIEAGQISPASSLVDVQSLIQGQVNYLEPRIQQRHVSIQQQVEKEPALLFTTDAYLLQVIFVNVLSNAIEFSLPGQEIIIQAGKREADLVVRVQDFGTGIDSSQKKYIFERFRQLDTGTTKIHPGQGLGLSIVNEFIELLGGKLQLDSARNAGTTVTLLIPPLQTTWSPHGFSSAGNDVLFEENEQEF